MPLARIPAHPTFRAEYARKLPNSLVFKTKGEKDARLAASTEAMRKEVAEKAAATKRSEPSDFWLSEVEKRNAGQVRPPKARSAAPVWRVADDGERGSERSSVPYPRARPAAGTRGSGGLNLTLSPVEKIGEYIPMFYAKRPKPSPHRLIKRPGKVGVNHPELGQVLFDRPKEEIAPYDPSDRHTFHEYEHVDALYVGSDYDREAMWKAFLSYPAPGASGEPIDAGKRTEVRDPVAGWLGGFVTHGVNPETRTLTNVTEEDHSFHDGSVQRTLVFTDRGVFVYTLGRGNNHKSLLMDGDNYLMDDVNESPLVVYGTWDTINGAVRRKYKELLRGR